MRRKDIKLSSSALFLLTLITSVSPVLAFTSTDTTTGTSNATVTFTAPDDSTTLPSYTDPVNPTNPDGTPNEVTPTPGALALDNASDISFGSHTVGQSTSYVATKGDNGGTSGDTGDFTPYVSWHDLDGVTKNFTITASTAGFTDMSSATITLGAGSAKNVTPPPSGGTQETDISAVTPNQSAITLTNDNSANNIAADTGAVSGYYANIFSSATLSVPVAQQTAGAHTATITWTLNATP